MIHLWVISCSESSAVCNLQIGGGGGGGVREDVIGRWSFGEAWRGGGGDVGRGGGESGRGVQRPGATAHILDEVCLHNTLICSNKSCWHKTAA